MKHKTISKQTIWIFTALVATSILTLAFTTIGNRPQQESLLTYKNIIRAHSKNGLYAEPAQEVNNTDNKDAKGTLESISFGDEKIEAIICLDLPNTESWIPDAKIKIKDDVIEWSDFALINSKDPTTYTSTNRCFLIGFPYKRTDEKKIHVNISVNLFQDNGSDLAGNETAKKIKDKLHVNYPELDFEIVTDIGNNGGGGSIRITSKPATMSEDKTLQLIYDATIEKGNGQWDFDIDMP